MTVRAMVQFKFKFKGCKYDGVSSETPRCSPGMKCNLDTHICGAESGSTLLQLMVFTSNGCNGCDQEGVTMILTGSDNGQRTKDLDHPSVPDCSKGQTTFVASKEEQEMGWY